MEDFTKEVFAQKINLLIDRELSLIESEISDYRKEQFIRLQEKVDFLLDIMARIETNENNHIQQ